jgi:hypothetical protein
MPRAQVLVPQGVATWASGRAASRTDPERTQDPDRMKVGRGRDRDRTEAAWQFDASRNTFFGWKCETCFAPCGYSSGPEGVDQAQRLFGHVEDLFDAHYIIFLSVVNCRLPFRARARRKCLPAKGLRLRADGARSENKNGTGNKRFLQVRAEQGVGEANGRGEVGAKLWPRRRILSFAEKRPFSPRRVAGTV